MGVGWGGLWIARGASFTIAGRRQPPEPVTAPDPRFSTETLQRNLQVLREVQPELAERLTWPVVGDHVAIDAAGGVRYRLHMNSFRLELAPPGVARRTSGKRGSVGVFGLGLGEEVAALLAQTEVERVVAWDRDPWLVRLALSAHDWSEALRCGRLRLRLGIDLLDADFPAQVCEHPTLTAVYSRERRLLEGVLPGRRALICEGGLFVPSVARSLTAEGFAVYTFDVERLALEELALIVARFRPELLFSINYREGLAEFCEEQGIRLVCWEIDPSTSFVRPLSGGGESASIFTYRSEHVREFGAAGFPRVEYLALASDPRLRAPEALEAAELAQVAAPVSFVGSSMVRTAGLHARRFVELYRAWRTGAEEAEGTALLRELLEHQREDFSLDRIRTALDRIAPGWVAHCRRANLEDPRVLAGEVAASEKRLNWVAALAPHGVQVWGDQGWSRLAEHGVSYRGLAGHAQELTRIYSATAINLDVGRLFQSDIVTMRVFDVLATGSFVLAEHTRALAEAFDVGREVISYRGRDELLEKTAYYLEHVDEAREIAARGRAAVLERHTVSERLRYMLGRAGICAEAGSPMRYA